MVSDLFNERHDRVGVVVLYGVVRSTECKATLSSTRYCVTTNGGTVPRSTAIRLYSYQIVQICTCAPKMRKATVVGWERKNASLMEDMIIATRDGRGKYSFRHAR